jgi:hypothetical protein
MMKEFSVRHVLRSVLILFFLFFVALLAGSPLAYGQSQTTTTVSSTANPSTYGNWVFLTATISSGYCARPGGGGRTLLTLANRNR